MKKYFLLFSWLLLFHCSPALAQSSFEDDFSANLDKWELVNGSWNYWQINEQALYATISQFRKLSTIVPKDEFWQDMEEYEVDFVFKVFDGTDKNFVVGMRDAGNFYDLHFYGNSLIVEDIRNGLSIHSETVPFDLELNHDYLVHILYSKEKIELLMDDEEVFHTDQFWSPPLYGGKFGLKISTGLFPSSRAYFDQVAVKEVDSRDVLFKQDDSSWATEIYDHADLWSAQPTMSRWACALSSAAMLLRSYGYYFLPAGEELNPLSLNRWLLSQEDGYIDDGLVNWLAISRLSKLLSEQSNNLLPALEFNYFAGSDEEILTELRENLVDVPGQIATNNQHFFLVSQYLSELHDFVIKDPLYEESLLSEKITPIASLRIFTPSLTDLSYLMVVLPKTWSLVLSRETGEILEGFTSFEQIENGEEKIGEDNQLVYYAKPDSALFNLVISSNDFTAESIAQAKIFLYQSDGSVQLVSLTDLMPDQQVLPNVKSLNLTLNYFKDAESEITLAVEEKTVDEQEQAKLDEWAAWSRTNFENGKLSFYLFYQLNLLIDSLRDCPKYFFLLDKFLRFHQL